MPVFRSFAKINLHLEVLGRRPDGFHELRTVFQSVSLHDRITLERTAAAIELEVRGEPVPGDRTNLAWRAAEAFLERWGDGGVAMRLDKRIPVGGGLGGGSSNAATVLLALRGLFGEPAAPEELVETAAALGSDVPYFLVGGTALGTGRGERVTALPDLVEERLWIVDPGVRVSTREVFAAGPFARSVPDDERIERLRRGETRRPSEVLGRNDLESRVLRRYPQVEAVYTALVQSGVERVGVTGSGAAVCAFAGRLDECPLNALASSGVRCFDVTTLSRRSIASRQTVDSVEGP